MKINLLKDFRRIASNSRHLTVQDIVAATREGNSGELVWDQCHSRDNVVDICAAWPGWPQCGCSCCGCDEPATTTDDGGCAVCEACSTYTCDDDGCVVCSKDDRSEIVTESCGAGNQTRSYVRIKPPTMPETDDAGEYALYWETCGDDAGPLARFATAADAAQAVAAKDWPRPGDNTHYLCGWNVRQLVDGEWMPLSEGQ